MLCANVKQLLHIVQHTTITLRWKFAPKLPYVKYWPCSASRPRRPTGTGGANEHPHFVFSFGRFYMQYATRPLDLSWIGCLIWPGGLWCCVWDICVCSYNIKICDMLHVCDMWYVYAICATCIPHAECGITLHGYYGHLRKQLREAYWGFGSALLSAMLRGVAAMLHVCSTRRPTIPASIIQQYCHPTMLALSMQNGEGGCALALCCFCCC